MEARGALGRPFWDSSPLVTPIIITWTMPGHFYLVRAVPGAVTRPVQHPANSLVLRHIDLRGRVPAQLLHTLACVHTCSLTPGVLFGVLRSSFLGMATGYNFTELKRKN